LYLVKSKRSKQERYCWSEEERLATIEEFGEGNVTIQRYKGLGEMNALNCGKQQWTPKEEPCVR
jgi:DNA gyrase subunit B